MTVDGWCCGSMFLHPGADGSAAAYASFSTMTGSLEKGKRFDAVVWDDDLMTAPQGELLDVRVKTTIVDGQIVFGQLS